MSRPKPDPLSADTFRGFYADILHFLRKRTDNASDAADMTQDVFTQWLDYDQQAKVEQPRAFLFQMARNLLRDHWRKQKVRQAVHSEQVDPEQEPVADPAQAGFFAQSASKIACSFAHSSSRKLPTPLSAVPTCATPGECSSSNCAGSSPWAVSAPSSGRPWPCSWAARVCQSARAAIVLAMTLVLR
uniref:RNA polymerase sigma factor n=1 Tax=Pseudomonas asplenii TaxID=53407 RepID=UPI001ED8DBB8